MYRLLIRCVMRQVTKCGILFLKVPPSLVTSAANATKTVGESVKFECSFNGIPNPDIQWFYMPSGGSRVQLTQTDHYVITAGSLEIGQILKKDEGMYICRAVNVAGSLESSAYLRVKGIFIFHLLKNSFDANLLKSTAGFDGHLHP